MGLRKLKPYSPGTRHATVPDFAEITKTRPEKSLTEVLKKTSGRNNQGRITVRHRGGGIAASTASSTSSAISSTSKVWSRPSNTIPTVTAALPCALRRR